MKPQAARISAALQQARPGQVLEELLYAWEKQTTPQTAPAARFAVAPMMDRTDLTGNKENSEVGNTECSTTNVVLLFVTAIRISYKSHSIV
ncbi:MAG: hypothetical protein MnENMB40S_14620 [Rhizobiaceae bacterium MnEN-MB40S]|nr:MAG: hypothetical protein MnENMB40S_14620 [Rhizobiaceae bacterium MnEN-MB40S]